MTVGDLITRLQEFPKELEVICSSWSADHWTEGTIYSIAIIMNREPTRVSIVSELKHDS